jgi:hypothetical protein
MNRLKLLVLAAVLAVLCALPVSALAHDMDYTTSIPDFDEYSVDHYDQPDYKGWFNLTVTNTGSGTWGKFHFRIFGAPGAESVEFVESGDNAPTSSQVGTWVIDNSGFAQADYYFSGDPVLPTESATFSLYTNNPDNLSFFGVSFYPSPVPVPGALWLLGSGLLGIVAMRRKFNT